MVKYLPKGSYTGTAKTLQTESESLNARIADSKSKSDSINNTLTTNMLPQTVAGDVESVEFPTAYNYVKSEMTETMPILTSFKTAIDNLNILDAKFESIKATDPNLSSYRFLWNSAQ